MLVPLLLTVLAPAHADDARVLMIGNSYTAQQDLHTRVADALEGTVPGWSEVYAHAVTRGGTTLGQHAAEADGSNGDTAWRDALVTGPDAGSWDWVVLQDQSQIPGFPESNSDWQDSRDGAVILDGLIGDGGGETVFLLTWGRRDGDSTNPTRFPDFPTMQAHLTEGYLAYAEACGADGTPAWIIPAGHAWGVVYQDLLDGGDDPTAGDTAFTALYSSDGSHPSAAGSHLAALTSAAALTGRSVANVEPPSDVDTTLASTLRDAADRAVLDEPFGEIPYRWAFEWDDWESPTEVFSDADVVISDLVTRPAVRVGSEVQPVDMLELGADHHSGTSGAGRLWVDEGGVLDAQVIDACDGGCQVVLAGGELSLHDATIYDLEHRGGTLRISGALAVPAGYELAAEAALQLQVAQADVPLINAGDAVTLRGAITVEVDDALAASGEELWLVQGYGIELDSSNVVLPDGASLTTVGDGDGELLVLRWDGSQDSGSSGDTGDDSGPGTSKGDCGCGSGSGTPPAWLLLGLVVPALRRRGR